MNLLALLMFVAVVWAGEPVIAAPVAAPVYPPPVAAPVAPTWPAVQRFPLAPGAEIWWLSRPDLPLALVEILLLPPFDPADELPQRLAGALLGEGTQQADRADLARRADLAGLWLQTGADSLGAWAAVLAPRAHLEQGLDLLQEVVFEPAFPRRALRRLRREWRRSYVQAASSPGRTLALAERRAIYPAGHPLAQLPDRGDYRRLTLRRVQQRHRQWLEQSRMVVLVAGDVDPSIVAARLAGPLAGRAPVEEMAPLAPPPDPAGLRLVLMDDPQASQTRMVLSLPAPAAASVDWPMVTLVNQVLGGDFTARLNRRLREELGLSYGVYSELQAWPGFSRLRISGALALSRTGEAVAEIQDILLGMGDISEEELARAQAGLNRDAAAHVATLRQLGERLDHMAVLGLPPEHDAASLEAANEIRLPELQVAAAKLCDPSRATLLLLTNRELVEPQLEALGLAPDTIWSRSYAAYGH